MHKLLTYVSGPCLNAFTFTFPSFQQSCTMVISVTKAIQYFSIAKCIPYKLVVGPSKIIIFQRSRFQQIGSGLNQLLSWFQIAFVLGSYWVHVADYIENIKLFELAMHTIWVFAFICVAAINVFMTWEVDNVPTFFKNIQRLQKHLKGMYIRS